MYDVLIKFLSDFFCVVLLFFVSFFMVVGTKYVYYKFIELFPKKPIFSNKEIEDCAPKKPPRKRKPIRSIEINPDEIDRIYVKKIS